MRAPTDDPLRVGPWLDSRAAQHGEREALTTVGGGESLNFSQLQARSAALAGALRDLGLKPGDGIAIWLPNRPTWMAVHLAAARLGLLTVPINTWCRESELHHFMRLARCRAVVVDSRFRGIDFLGVLETVIDSLNKEGGCPLEWIIEAGQTAGAFPGNSGIRTKSLAALEADSNVPHADGLGENLAMIAYSTSGTTSTAKLAVHREAALLAHAGAVARRAHMTTDDVVLGALPPCGAYGYTLLMAAMSAGSHAFIIDEFELDAVFNAIVSECATILALTEPIMRRLLDHPRASREAFRSLRLVFSAGGTLLPVVERAEREFGFRVTNVYGSSEILALAAFWDLDRDVAARSQAGGRLTSEGMKVRAVDTTGRPLPAGREGELQFSGPIVTRGYLANPEADRKAFTVDGWFASGDLGSVMERDDEEFLYAVRLNDAIRIKGFLVSPGEIEAMLQTHPSVAAAQVVGIPDGLGEELAAAFIVPRDGMTVAEADLRAYCRARMASYKAPAILQVIDAFPMTRSANGDKVMKNKLRDLARSLHTA